MHCLLTRTICQADEGTVEYAYGFSVGIKGQINTALAGEIGIEATGEFRYGTTNTTRKEVCDAIECGPGEGTVDPNRHFKYEIRAYRQHKKARQEVRYRWYFKFVYEEGGSSEWILLEECPGRAYNTIDGFKGLDQSYGCYFVEEVECPDCPENEPCCQAH